MDDKTKQEVHLALDILKKRWKLKNKWEVIRHLIETADKTVLQLAERKARMKNPDGDGNE